MTAAIDNGIINHRHMIFVNMMNPNAGFEPCYLLSETTDYYRSQDFKMFGEILFRRLDHQGITLVGFVGDNLRAQISGLAHWSPHSMQQNSNDNQISAVLYVPCCCHTLNLALNDLKIHCPLYSSVMKVLDALTVFLRKPEITNRLAVERQKSQKLDGCMHMMRQCGL